MIRTTKYRFWFVLSFLATVGLMASIMLISTTATLSSYPGGGYPGPTSMPPTSVPGGGSVTLTHSMYFPTVRHFRFNVEDYMLVSLPGQKLCTDVFASFCVDGDWTPDNKEFYWAMTNSQQTNLVLDYLGIVQTSHGKVIGPIRNFDTAIGYLRCFAGGTVCTVPATAPALPSYGIPTPLSLPVVANADYVATTSTYNCPYGTCPDEPLSQAMQLVDDRISRIEYDTPSTNCTNQTYQGYVDVEISAAIVDWVDFGGDLGVQNNVLVIDALQGTVTLDSLERYYYVYGYGRVKESWGRDSNNDGTYQEQPRNASNRRYVLSGDGNWVSSHDCVQGSLLTRPQE